MLEINHVAFYDILVSCQQERQTHFCEVVCWPNPYSEIKFTIHRSAFALLVITYRLCKQQTQTVIVNS
jgi:hypothetical protein